MQDRREKDYTFSTKYICVYRNVHQPIIYNLIKPFTANCDLFEQLLQTIIFVDIDQKQLPFTDIMIEQFSKLKASPSLIYTISGEIITDEQLIMATFFDVYNDIITVLNSQLDDVFKNDCNGNGGYITEIWNLKSGFDLDNVNDIQNYVNQYNYENKKQKEDYSYKPQASTHTITQLKEVPLKSSVDKQNIDLNNLNLNI